LPKKSFGVFTAACIIYFKPEYAIVDPICTFVFSLTVVATTIPILRDTIRIVMQKVPSDICYDEVMEALLSVKVGRK